MTRLVAARNECAEGEHSKFQRPFLQTVMSVGPISNRAATLRRCQFKTLPLETWRSPFPSVLGARPAAAGAAANSKLTFHLDHPMGSDHDVFEDT